MPFERICRALNVMISCRLPRDIKSRTLHHYMQALGSGSYKEKTLAEEIVPNI